MSFWHSVTDFFGITNEAGPGYGFFSGVGSDLGEYVIIGGLIASYRRINCHTKGCWRIGRHHVEGTPYVVCGHHHPDVPDQGATHSHILELHYRRKTSR